VIVVYFRGRATMHPSCANGCGLLQGTSSQGPADIGAVAEDLVVAEAVDRAAIRHADADLIASDRAAKQLPRGSSNQRTAVPKSAAS